MARRMDRGASVGGTKKTKLSTKQNKKKQWRELPTAAVIRTLIPFPVRDEDPSPPVLLPLRRTALSCKTSEEQKNKKKKRCKTKCPAGEWTGLCARNIICLFPVRRNKCLFGTIVACSLGHFRMCFCSWFFFFSFLSSGRQSEWSTALKLLVLFFQTWRPSGIFAYTCTCFESCCSWQLDALGYCFMLVV